MSAVFCFTVPACEGGQGGWVEPYRALQDRVIAAIEGGLSCRQAAERFGVTAASAIQWR